MSPARRFVAGTAALGFLLFGCPSLYAIARSAGHMYSAQDVSDEPVALVLGAQIYPDGTPSPYLKARLDLAKQLWDLGKVRAVLVSGDNGTDHYNEPDGMRNYLINAGIPAEKVVADYAGFDTYDSCVRARQIFGVNELTVVTQSYHLRRAVATCRSVGVDAVGVGDETVKAYSSVWHRGVMREIPACLKMVWDVASRRQPVLGPPEDGIRRALES